MCGVVVYRNVSETAPVTLALIIERAAAYLGCVLNASICFISFGTCDLHDRYSFLSPLNSGITLNASSCMASPIESSKSSRVTERSIYLRMNSVRTHDEAEEYRVMSVKKCGRVHIYTEKWRHKKGAHDNTSTSTIDIYMEYNSLCEEYNGQGLYTRQVKEFIPARFYIEHLYHDTFRSLALSICNSICLVWQIIMGEMRGRNKLTEQPEDTLRSKSEETSLNH